MRLILITILLFISPLLKAQFSEKESKQDTIKTSFLEEVVISANKIPEQRRTVSQQIRVLTPTFIRNFNAQTSADLLSNSGVVAMQKSQQGGGSPILRGFEASRVLMVVDGVRLNNAIYRAGHLQNVITMDNNSIDRVEILFGPSSTVYGSDALGGVVHFYTRDPELSTNDKQKFGGSAFVRLGSANQEKTGHLDLNFAGKRLGSFTSITFSEFGDLRMGKKTNSALGEQFGLRNQYVVRSEDNSTDLLIQNEDPYVQKFSGYKQYDLLQKVMYQPNKRVSHTLNMQFSNSSNIPRYDRLTDPQASGLRFAEWYYGPQTRVMTAYQFKVKELGKWADAMNATASYQHIEESRYDRRFGNNFRNERIEKVDVFGVTVDFQKNKGLNSYRYGIDGQFNKVNSSAQRFNVSTGAVSALSTRYPDGGSAMNMLSAYITHTKKLSDLWTLNDGIRLGGSWLNSKFNDKTFFPFPFDEVKQKYLVSSANAGIIYTPSFWKFSLLTSSGYRAPNVDDLAKVFDSAPGKVIIPNPELRAEKTLNADLALTRFFGNVARFEGTFFATNFFDALVVVPGTFNGQTIINYDGTPSEVLTVQNKGRAYLLGYSLNFRAEITQELIISASHNYTRGRVINDNAPETPLDHIAPSFGRIAIQYTNEKLRSELFTNFSGWKYLSRYSNSGEDNLQYATSKGMPSWYTINLRLAYDFSNHFTLQSGVDNLLDLQYRTFASGINASGRNIFVTAKFNF